MQNKFIITIQKIEDNRQFESVQFEIPEDSDLWDWKYIFTAILSFISFNPEQIQKFFEGDDNEETNHN